MVYHLIVTKMMKFLPIFIIRLVMYPHSMDFLSMYQSFENVYINLNLDTNTNSRT